MEPIRKEACDICHKKPAVNRKLTGCKRCKRNVCGDCSKDKIAVNSLLIKTYLRVGGKVTSSTVQVCDFCRNQVSTLRKLKETNKLKFCTESKVGVRLLRMVSGASAEQIQEDYREVHRLLKLRQKQEIYQRARTTILDEKLYNRAQLSQPLFELGCLVAVDTRDEQQNEKLKHLLLALSTNKPVDVLKCLAPLAIFLTMFLTEQQTYHFITRLYRDFVPECFWLKREEEIQGLTAAFKTEFENDRMVLPFCNSLNEFYAQAWRSLTAGKVVPDVTLAVLEFVVQDKQNVIANFNRALSVVIRAGMKASNADEDLPEQIMHVDASSIKTQLTVKDSPKKADSPDRIRKISQQLSLGELAQQNEVLRQENQRLRNLQEELVMEFRQKYQLILDNLHVDEQALREHHAKIQGKLNQEKNEYIEKIVKLGDEIERLNADLAKMRECEKYYLQEIELLQSRLSHAIRNKGDEHFQSISPSSMVGDRMEKKKLLLGLIEALPTDFQVPIKIMSKEEVDQLEKDWVAHLKPKLSTPRERKFSGHRQAILEEDHQMKRRPSRERLDSETTRLLGVLAKKEEKFVLCINEKDRIIECYEEILWHIENRLELPSNNIANRVQTIINARKGDGLTTTSAIVGSGHKKVKQKEDCALF